MTQDIGTAAQATRLLASFLCCMMLAGVAHGEDVRLISQEKSHGHLFLPREQGEPLRLAAEELRNYLERMTGARLPLAWGEPRPTDKGIVLSVRDRSEWVGEESAQAFTIEEDGRFITIKGNTETAVLYGVYQYLHELGVRWFFPGEVGEHVPQRQEVVIGEGKQTHSPSFVQRHLSHSGSFGTHFDSSLPAAEREKAREEYSLWHIRNRTHFLYNIPRDDWFEFNWPIRAGSGHGLRRFVLGEADLQEEPERFPKLIRDGELVRTDTGARQICFTNDTNVKVAIEQVVAMIEQKEAARDARNDDLYETWAAVSMGLADNSGICQCEACRETAGSLPYADDRLVWTFYNRVMEGVVEQKPDGKIYLFAPYMDLSRPPEDVTIHPHLVASTARTTTWSAAPEDEAFYPFTRTFEENIKATRDAGAEVRAREYVLWWGTPQPLNIFDAAQRYHELGYEHYNLEVMNRSMQVWPVLWVLAQYTWDAEKDPDELLEAYCRQSFGEKGGAVVLDLLRAMDENSRNIHRIQWGNLYDTHVMLPDELIDRGLLDLQAAMTDSQGRAEQRLAIFRDTFEMLGRKARSYRAYCRALNDREPTSVAQALEEAEGFLGFWDDNAIGRTCSPRIRGLVEDLKEALENLDEAEPAGREELADPEMRRKAIFANPDEEPAIPDDVAHLVELPEVWRFRVDYEDEGLDQGWHEPSYEPGGRWQPLSTWDIFARQGYPRVHGRYWYRLEFEAPRFPDDAPVFLRIGSLDEEGQIYINGELVYEQGETSNWNRSFAFDVTPHLDQGEANTIAVRGFAAYGGAGLWRPSALYTR